MNKTDSPPPSQIAVSSKSGGMQRTKEHNERLKIARARVKEAERRKLEELRQSFERAEEVRRKQEEDRHRKIEEMKKRDEKHRANVEERRRKLFEEENEKKQAILKRAEEHNSKVKQIKLKKPSATLSASSINQILSPRVAELDSEFRSARDLANASPAERKMLRRLSSSIDLISAIRPPEGTDAADPSDTTDDRPEEIVDFRHTSAVEKSQAKSMESVRKSLVDVRKKSESSVLTKSGSADVIPTSEKRKTARLNLTQALAMTHIFGSKAAPSSSSEEPLSPAASKRPSTSRALSSSSRLPQSPDSSRASPAKNAISPPKSSTPTSFQLKTKKDGAVKKTPALSKAKMIGVKILHEIVVRKPGIVKEKLMSSDNKDVMEKSVSGDGESTNSQKNPDSSKVIVADEKYKQKLAENRRLAREKAEREATEDRQRVEEEKRREEEQRRLEEEEQERFEREQLQLAETAKRQEEERLLLAIEAAERQRREEDQLEADKLATEKRTREEAERKEKERLDKCRREEEERLERKKKIEMIMKRVKPDDNIQKELKESKSSENVSGFSEPSHAKFVSPLLSPLLQQIIGRKGRSAEDSVATTGAASDVAANEKLSGDVNSQNDQSEDEVAVEAIIDQVDDLTVELESNGDLGVVPTSSISPRSQSAAASDAVTSESSGLPCSDVNQLHSNLEVIELATSDDQTVRTSDNNKDWTIAVGERKDNLAAGQSLPDLPRIAFEDGPLSVLPDILR